MTQPIAPFVTLLVGCCLIALGPVLMWQWWTNRPQPLTAPAMETMVVASANSTTQLCEPLVLSTWTDPKVPVVADQFIQQLSRRWSECSQQQFFTIQSTYRPNGITLPGHPSRAEIVAEKRANHIARMLRELGVPNSRIQHFAVQSGQNSLTVTVSKG